MKFSEFESLTGIALDSVETVLLDTPMKGYLKRTMMEAFEGADDKIKLVQRVKEYKQSVFTKIEENYYRAEFTVSKLGAKFILVLIELVESVSLKKRTLILTGEMNKWLKEGASFREKFVLIKELLENDQKRRQLSEVIKMKAFNMIDRNFSLVDDLEEAICFI